MCTNKTWIKLSISIWTLCQGLGLDGKQERFWITKGSTAKCCVALSPAHENPGEHNKPDSWRSPSLLYKHPWAMVRCHPSRCFFFFFFFLPRTVPEWQILCRFLVLFNSYCYAAFAFCYTKRPAAQVWLLHSSHTLLPTMAASLYLGPMFALESSSSFWFRAQMVISLEAISRGKHNRTRHSLWTHVS